MKKMLAGVLLLTMSALAWAQQEAEQRLREQRERQVHVGRSMKSSTDELSELLADLESNGQTTADGGVKIGGMRKVLEILEIQRVPGVTRTFDQAIAVRERRREHLVQADAEIEVILKDLRALLTSASADRRLALYKNVLSGLMADQRRLLEETKKWGRDQLVSPEKAGAMKDPLSGRQAQARHSLEAFTDALKEDAAGERDDKLRELLKNAEAALTAPSATEAQKKAEAAIGAGSPDPALDAQKAALDAMKKALDALSGTTPQAAAPDQPPTLDALIQALIAREKALKEDVLRAAQAALESGRAAFQAKQRGIADDLRALEPRMKAITTAAATLLKVSATALQAMGEAEEHLGGARKAESAAAMQRAIDALSALAQIVSNSAPAPGQTPPAPPGGPTATPPPDLQIAAGPMPSLPPAGGGLVASAFPGMEMAPANFTGAPPPLGPPPPLAPAPPASPMSPMTPPASVPPTGGMLGPTALGQIPSPTASVAPGTAGGTGAVMGAPAPAPEDAPPMSQLKGKDKYGFKPNMKFGSKDAKGNAVARGQELIEHLDPVSRQQIRQRYERELPPEYRGMTQEYFELLGASE